ncbi:MAG: hypothetical protein ACYTBZ_05680 [Planctomycetota bacterium]|jgi:hypothetical protein
MKCVFCAEEIQDAAILCRFCGAVKRDGQWLAPVRKPRPKGWLTIKIAGWFFAVSALFSFFFFTSEVPLFGAMRGGFLAAGYNLFYTGLFLAVAVGLIVPKPWGRQVMLMTTILYTVDKLLFISNKATRDAYLAASGVTEQVTDLLGIDILEMLHLFIIVIGLTVIACWWGFVWYLFMRKEYFQQAG